MCASVFFVKGVERVGKGGTGEGKGDGKGAGGRERAGMGWEREG